MILLNSLVHVKERLPVRFRSRLTQFGDCFRAETLESLLDGAFGFLIWNFQVLESHAVATENARGRDRRHFPVLIHPPISCIIVRLRTLEAFLSQSK